MSWSSHEVKLIVADYFNMLSAEINGNHYSKAEHRRNLIPLLQNRSEGSIEFKHQNISAILIELGQPFIMGYLPRYNYQQILRSAIIEYLKENARIEDQFRLFADREIEVNEPVANYSNLIVEPPQGNFVPRPNATFHKGPIKINYLEREQRNQNLGLLGEKLVLEYEKWSLVSCGKEKYADQVRWISKEEGDGAGFDILSRNLNGTDKYIEVKTTKLSKETPIFFSKNELDFSVAHSRDFHLYRVFNFDRQARLFRLNGSLDKICRPEPVSYKGYF